LNWKEYIPNMLQKKYESESQKIWVAYFVYEAAATYNGDFNIV